MLTNIRLHFVPHKAYFFKYTKHILFLVFRNYLEMIRLFLFKFRQVILFKSNNDSGDNAQYKHF